MYRPAFAFLPNTGLKGEVCNLVNVKNLVGWLPEEGKHGDAVRYCSVSLSGTTLTSEFRAGYEI